MTPGRSPAAADGASSRPVDLAMPVDAGLSELRERLEVAEETLRAIRAGEVDAIVSGTGEGKRVFILDGADRPYRVFVERMPVGGACLSREGIVLYANPHLARMLDRHERKLLGRSFLEFVAPEHQALVRDRLHQPSPAGTIEIELIRRGKRTLPLRLALTALSDETMIGIMTDLTERRRRRQAVARAEAMRANGRVMRHALAARREAEEALRVAHQRKDDFLATLSHELRNPLASIRNMLHFLKLRGSDDPDLLRAREILERQVHQTVRLIDDLMDVARISRGVLDLQIGVLRLSELLADVDQACRHLLLEGGHSFRVHAPQGDIFLRGDRVRLSQVLGNLLSNAARYTPKGGRIELEAGTEGAELVVRVRDNGIGIPADKLNEIFRPFERADATPGTGGLGIGLALAHRIVALHKGSIAARSGGRGQGSEFVVRLPIVVDRPLARAPRDSTPAASPPPQSRRVLVADDNDDAAESLAMLLRVLGHEVVTANDGQEALEYAESGWFDLALLDIGMPRLDGYELARRIRAEPWGRSIRLIALTGWGQDSDKRRARESGFDDHLTKPVDPGCLTAVLAALPEAPAR